MADELAVFPISEKLTQATKACKLCSRTLPLTTEYFQSKVVKGKMYFSSCKDCYREKARKRQARRRSDPVERVVLLAEKKRYAQSAKGRAYKRVRSQIDNQRRRQRAMNIPFAWTEAHWEQTVSDWGGCCVYCGSAGEMTLDHFIPVSNPDCPGTVPWNVVPACAHCNSSKGNRMPMDWCKDSGRVTTIADWLATR